MTEKEKLKVVKKVLDILGIRHGEDLTYEKGVKIIQNCYPFAMSESELRIQKILREIVRKLENSELDEIDRLICELQDEYDFSIYWD